MSFSRAVKKIHIYTGLANLTMLMVFGIAGLAATMQIERSVAETTEIRPFDSPPNLNDVEAAAAAHTFLRLPAAPPPRGAVRRDGANNVTFTVYSVNGPRTITLLEKEHRLRIHIRRNRLWHFFDDLHTTTPGRRGVGLPVRMWSWYVEFSIWSLILMSVSGVYLWLASRPGHRWAQISLATGSGGLLLLYAWMR